MPDAAAADEPILRIRDVRFGYQRRHPVLKGIDLEVRPGEIVGISGENGSGKSTLLKLIVGLLKPQEGTVERTGQLGYSPQTLLLFEHLTVRENFQVFGRGLGLDRDRIRRQSDHAMEALQYAQYADRQVAHLSGGTQQKLNFSLSLLGAPRLLVLDEPYQGLDHASFLKFWQMQRGLREHGLAVVIVSHLIQDQERFTRSLHLVDGRIQACTRPGCDCCGC